LKDIEASAERKNLICHLQTILRLSTPGYESSAFRVLGKVDFALHCLKTSNGRFGRVYVGLKLRTQF